MQTRHCPKTDSFANLQRHHTYTYEEKTVQWHRHDCHLWENTHSPNALCWPRGCWCYTTIWLRKTLAHQTAMGLEDRYASLFDWWYMAGVCPVHLAHAQYWIPHQKGRRGDCWQRMTIVTPDPRIDCFWEVKGSLFYECFDRAEPINMPTHLENCWCKWWFLRHISVGFHHRFWYPWHNRHVAGSKQRQGHHSQFDNRWVLRTRCRVDGICFDWCALA